MGYQCAVFSLNFIEKAARAAKHRNLAALAAACNRDLCSKRVVLRSRCQLPGWAEEALVASRSGRAPRQVPHKYRNK